jgi:hypothetical protein
MSLRLLFIAPLLIIFVDFQEYSDGYKKKYGILALFIVALVFAFAWYGDIANEEVVVRPRDLDEEKSRRPAMARSPV